MAELTREEFLKQKDQGREAGEGDDSRVRLLLALKPNLSPERQAKVDSAIKILKLIELAPLLREMGILNL